MDQGIRVSETEEAPGVTSSMRVTVKSGRRVGAFMVFYGATLATAMIVLNRGYELAATAALMVSTGAGMITGLGIAKAVQSRFEGRGGEGA